MKPLSIDLRKRVIEATDSGMHIDQAVKVFKVCRRVIYNWLELRKKTNSLAPKSGYQNGHSHKITDWEQFKVFAEANRQRTIPQMVIEWQQLTGISASESVIGKALKKIGYTSKKNFQLRRSQPS
jgi:transposase